ncbi:hypothetical protein BDY24DRAFT_377353 [Mrakia frigida]|uniref:PQ-loop repeat-containing protein n=1 Tax=Mrakia frigida TaxID=29902 RepID=UPI003FCC26A6
MLPYEPSQCEPTPNLFALGLSSFLCFGLVVSYLPQHLRIYQTKSSEGLSPWYLLLGSTSAACGLFNLLILQWPKVRCCAIISTASCFSATLGLLQVAIAWVLFSIIFILFLIYFPPHLLFEPPLLEGAVADKKAKTTPLWKLSVGLASVTAIHFIVTLAVLVPLLLRLPLPHPNPNDAPDIRLSRIADAHGLVATILAVSQYLPQILLTWNEGFIGSLSIPTMIIQVPGSVAFVVSIAIREGTSWSSWMPYAITGFLQSGLLVMCLCWKQREKRLGIDDFGRPLLEDDVNGEEDDERTPLVGAER